MTANRQNGFGQNNKLHQVNSPTDPFHHPSISHTYTHTHTRRKKHYTEVLIRPSSLGQAPLHSSPVLLCSFSMFYLYPSILCPPLLHPQSNYAVRLEEEWLWGYHFLSFNPLSESSSGLANFGLTYLQACITLLGGDVVAGFHWNKDVDNQPL